MVNSKKRIVVMLSFLALLFVFVIGISYAYYAAEVKGNNATDPSLKLTSGYLSIVYDGTSSSITGGSTSGTTTDLVYTKNFTVTNDGVADSNFGVWIKNYKVVDKEGNATTFTRPEDWTYTLKSGDTIIKSGTFPTQDQAIITAKPLAVGESATLTLTVTFNYITLEEATNLGLTLEEVNQTADMGKTLSFDISVTQSLDNLESAKEGTLLYAINENNVIVDPLTNPGKAASGSNFIELEPTTDTIELSDESQEYYVAYSDSYTFDKESGYYVLEEPVTIETYSTAYSKIEGKYITLMDSNSNHLKYSKMLFQVTTATNTSFTGDIYIIESETTLDEALIGSTEDDYGVSYYYRGNVKNNYVTYADMCWRIVRIDGNGNIKIVLEDKNFSCDSDGFTSNGTINTTDQSFVYNEVANTVEDMYFETSDTLNTLKAWMNGGDYKFYYNYNLTYYSGTGTFEQNISDEDQKKLVDAEWCSDLSMIDSNTFSSAVRLNSYTGNPTLRCDMVGVNNTKAVKTISKIGLLTADEIAFAGNAYEMTSNSYITSISTMTLTPSIVDSYMGIVLFESTNYLDEYDASSPWGKISPAVVLKSNVEITTKDVATYGEAGTQTNPYVIN